MNKIYHLASIAALLLSATACGKSETKSTDNTTESTLDSDAIIEAVQQHDRKQLSQAIDDMALNADDLSPKQAVSVLIGYYEIQTQYAAEHRTKQSLETMRNFVDVYDIVMSNHGNDFKKALSSTSQVFPDVDFTQVYQTYVDKLSGYEGGTPSPEALATDTAGMPTTPADSMTTTDSDQLPPELRPAE